MPNYGVGRFREIFLEKQMSELRLEELSHCDTVAIVKHVAEGIFLSEQKVYFVGVQCVEDTVGWAIGCLREGLMSLLPLLPDPAA